MARRQKIPDKIRKQIEIAADHCCSYCRSPLLAGAAMVVEHIVPLASGGTNELSNYASPAIAVISLKGQKLRLLIHTVVKMWYFSTLIGRSGLTISLGLKMVLR